MQLEIKIKEQTYNVGLQWGLGCFEIAADHLKVDTVDEVMFAAVKDSATMTRVAYSAIQNYIEIEDDTAVVPFTYRQFQAWISEQPEKLGKDIVSSFENSLYNGKSVKTYYDELSAMVEQLANPTPEPSDTTKKKATPRKPKSVK